MGNTTHVEDPFKLFRILLKTERLKYVYINNHVFSIYLLQRFLPRQAPVYGNWNVKRTHATWNHLTRDDSVCGKNTDVLSIASVSSKWCKNKHGSDGQAIVNQDGAELSFAWFCSNQGTTTIVGTPTFVPEEADGPCAHQHQVGDQGK